MSNPKKQTSEAAVREIRRRTRRKFSPKEKIRIVLEGLRGEQSVSDLCRREGIASNLYYRWSKDFLEAGKKQLAGDTVLEATSDEVKDLRSENRELKEVVAEIRLIVPFPFRFVHQRRSRAPMASSTCCSRSARSIRRLSIPPS